MLTTKTKHSRAALTKSGGKEWWQIAKMFTERDREMALKMITEINEHLCEAVSV